LSTDDSAGVGAVLGDGGDTGGVGEVDRVVFLRVPCVLPAEGRELVPPADGDAVGGLSVVAQQRKSLGLAGCGMGRGGRGWVRQCACGREGRVFAGDG